MARRGRPGQYPARSNSKSAGYRAAMRHIEEGKALSRELGGTDEDVKAYFFGLSRRELSEIFDEYGEPHPAPRPALRSRPNMLDRIALDPLTSEPMSLFREEGD